MKNGGGGAAESGFNGLLGFKYKLDSLSSQVPPPIDLLFAFEALQVDFMCEFC